MSADRQFQLLNLGSFLQSFFLPCKRHVRSEHIEQRPSIGLGIGSYAQDRGKRLDEQIQFQLKEIPRSASKFAAWEAYFWLHLGVELQVFPTSEAAEISTSFFDRPDLSNEPTFDYTPGALRHIYARSSRNGDPFPAGPHTSLPVDRAYQAAFQSAVQLETSFHRSSPSRHFIGAISYAGDQVWQSILFDQTKGNPRQTRRISIEKLADAFESEADEEIDIAPENILAGFCLTLEHMANLQQLFYNFSAVREIGPNLQNALEQRIREICNWRLNFLNPTVKDRFYGLADTAVTAIKDAAASDESSPLPANQHLNIEKMLDVLKLLGTNWERFVTANLSRGQSA